MILRHYSGILILIAMMACSSSTSAAQNPLRQDYEQPSPNTSSRSHVAQASHTETQIQSPRQIDQSGTQQAANNHPGAHMSPEVRRALYPNRSDNHAPVQHPPVTATNATQPAHSSTQPSPDQNRIQAQQPRVDFPTQPASHREAVNAEPSRNKGLEAIDHVLNQINSDRNPTTSQGSEPQLTDLRSHYRQPATDQSTSLENMDATTLTNEVPSAAEATGSTGKNDKFVQLIEKIAYNTLGVLTVAIGFIFVAKFWMKQKQPSSKTSAPKNDFEVINTLRVAPKANLMLVQVGDDRLVVATDAAGIKSVVRLTESFAGTLESFSEGATPHDFPAEPAPPVPPQTSERESTYSLASIGKSTNRNAPTQPNDPEAEIRRKMEAALAQHGFKDLILKTIQAEG